MAALPDSQALCERCDQINLEALKSAYGYVHQPSFMALIDSSSSWVKINADIGHIGPVRLFATVRTDGSSGIERRILETVQGRQLSPKVVVTVGELDRVLLLHPPWSILLEMYALKSSAAEQAGVASVKEIETHSACEANFSRLRKWLERCKRNHEICSLGRIKQLVGPSPMPKRLIDLGPPNPSPMTPKIVNTRGRQEQYVALSYCWGPTQPLTTTIESLRPMEKSIPVEKLPQTIKDAVLVARKLDVRYIWIDALCIIQDSEEDWRGEARRMGAIYANSYFTIAATAAKHSEEGFLWSRSLDRVQIPFRRSANSKIEGTMCFRDLSDFLRDHQKYILSSPLLKRAWVLQETLLSRRTVHFSSKQIYWECRSAFAAEDGGTDDADCREPAHEFLNMLDVLRGGIHSEELAMMFFRIWGKILSRYSALPITQPSDKLPALSGLASLVEAILGYRYLCGIWNYNLPYGLFWEPESRPMSRTKEWRAPSWSWASREGAIVFEKYFPEEDSTIRFIDETESTKVRGALKIMGQIHPCYVSLDVQPQPEPCRSDRKLKEIPITPPEYTFAEDTSQLLIYQASTETAPYDLYGETPGISLLRMTEGRLMSAQGSDGRNVCRFDGERGTETDFFFLRLACANRMDFHHCRGLLLRWAPGATGIYERVGIGWSTDSLWHTTSESLVTLL